jgi:predicted esterase
MIGGERGMADLGFVHVFQPPTAPAAPVLLLLHGTGGDEQDLLPIAARLSSAAGVLSPRGRVLERGMPRFFRRLAEGVFDLDDLHRQTTALAQFIQAAAAHYRFDPARVVAVGFSNGANIAASVLLSHPGVLAAAILFRAMVPFEPDAAAVLDRTPVLISSGRRDPIVPIAQVERLATLLTAAGADVTTIWQPGGHELTAADVSAAHQWLEALPAPNWTS